VRKLDIEMRGDERRETKSRKRGIEDDK